jgi:RNA polymerase sigma-70 factor (ECF subfamily)
MYAECVRTSGPACDQFFETVRPILTRVAHRVTAQFRASEDIEDVVQEMVMKLVDRSADVLAGMPQEPSVTAAYFSVVAANAARDFLRSRNAAKRGVSRTISMDDGLSSILGGARSDTDRTILLNEIETALPDDPKSKAVFRLYYRQGFTAREIAAIPGLELSLKGVESLIYRVTVQVRERLLTSREKGGGGKNPSQKGCVS